MATSDEEEKERCMKAYREEERKVKKCIYRSKKKVNGRKMNDNVNGNRKFFFFSSLS